MAAQHIVLYGKGGVGTSTTAANISAALAELGFRVVQIGFDARHDSTRTLRGDVRVKTILDLLSSKRPLAVEDVAVTGFKGVLCVEAGMPDPHVGCSGHGFKTVISRLGEPSFLGSYRPDFVLYDVSAEAVCGGITAPLLSGIAERVYVVSSSDFMSIFAANNILRTIQEHGAGGRLAFGGILANGLAAPFMESIIADFAAKTGVTDVRYIPRSLMVMQCELYGRTVIDAAPLSNHAYLYRRLARHMAEHETVGLPHALSREEMTSWARGWGDRIVELETGVISNGEGI